jgi:hypothetical protein
MQKQAYRFLCNVVYVMMTITLHIFCSSIFGLEGQEAEDITYVNWLALLYQAVGKALEMYQPSTKVWLQVNLSH